MTSKLLYETPSSEAFEVSLDWNFVQTNVEDPKTDPEDPWDNP